MVPKLGGAAHCRYTEPRRGIERPINYIFISWKFQFCSHFEVVVLKRKKGESCHGWEGRDDSPIGGATERFGN